MLRHQAHRLGERHCEVHSRPECTSCGIADEMCPVGLSQSSLCFGGSLLFEAKLFRASVQWACWVAFGPKQTNTSADTDNDWVGTMSLVDTSRGELRIPQVVGD